MIERNTTIPTSKSQVFSTYADNQPSVEIHVLQARARDGSWQQNAWSLPCWEISRQHHAVCRKSKLASILMPTVSLTYLQQTKVRTKLKITITSSSGLSDAEVEQMMKDAELHAEEDRKRKELVEAKTVQTN